MELLLKLFADTT